MKFSLETFGALRLISPTGDRVAYPEKGLLALCYLLTLPDVEYPRTSLARFLWDDRGDQDVMANLRKLISRLHARHAEVGHELFAFSATGVRVKVDAFAPDFAIFAAAPAGNAVLHLRKIAQVLRRDFLQDLGSQTATAQQWIVAQRDRQMALFVDALKRALPLVQSGEDVSLIKEAALRIFQSSPQNETVRHILLEAYDTEGQVGNARKLFEARRPGFDGIDQGLDPQALAEVRKVFDRQRAIGRIAPEPSDSPIGGSSSILPRIALLPPQLNGMTSKAQLLPATLIEDITIGLCALDTASVVAPYTAAQIARDADRTGTIIKHSIAYVLDTRLTDDVGGRMLFAQLIYAGGDEVLWAEHFNLENYDLIVHRREIALRIARAVAGRIRQNETVRGLFEASPAAYHSYLLGQRDIKRFSLPDIRRARKAFRTALQHSHDFAPALSGLARSYFIEWLLTARGDAELLQLTRDYASRAVAIDASLATGYRELGVAKLYLGDIDESVEAMTLAEELSPHYADIIVSFADVLVHASRPADALLKVERAMSLNPLCPDDYYWAAAGANFSLHRYSDALEAIAQMENRVPADRLSAASWAMLGDLKKAKTFALRAKETHPDFDVDRWLSIVPFKEDWQRDHYRQALKAAGF